MLGHRLQKKGNKMDWHNQRTIGLLTVFFLLVGCIFAQAQSSATIRIDKAVIRQVIDDSSALAYVNNKELILIDGINTIFYADNEDIAHNSFINDLNHPSGIELSLSITGIYKYTTVSGANRQVRRLTYLDTIPQPQPETKYRDKIISERRYNKLLKDHMPFIYKSPSGRLFNVLLFREDERNGEKIGIISLNKELIDKLQLIPAVEEDFKNYINYGGELYTVKEFDKKKQCDTCNGEGRLPQEKGKLGRRICPECKGKKTVKEIQFSVEIL